MPLLDTAVVSVAVFSGVDVDSTVHPTVAQQANIIEQMLSSSLAGRCPLDAAAFHSSGEGQCAGEEQHSPVGKPSRALKSFLGTRYRSIDAELAQIGSRSANAGTAAINVEEVHVSEYGENVMWIT